MWSAFISKQAVVISIYNTDWLLFKPEAEIVYCAARAECYIYFRYFSVLKESANALCFKEASVQAGCSPYEICGQVRGIVRIYSPSTLVFSCQHHSTSASDLSSS